MGQRCGRKRGSGPCPCPRRHFRVSQILGVEEYTHREGNRQQTSACRGPIVRRAPIIEARGQHYPRTRSLAGKTYHPLYFSSLGHRWPMSTYINVANQSTIMMASNAVSFFSSLRAYFHCSSIAIDWKKLRRGGPCLRLDDPSAGSEPSSSSSVSYRPGRVLFPRSVPNIVGSTIKLTCTLPPSPPPPFLCPFFPFFFFDCIGFVTGRTIIPAGLVMFAGFARLRRPRQGRKQYI